jgi:aryl-alcohol dehydrogenase-like predicted oxidoreductase
METRRLGGDGPPVTRLGIGLAALGRPAYITVGHDADFPEGRSPEDMERHAHAVLDAAYAASVRYFDAARSYGRAELFLRSWLDARRLAPGQVVVGSKWGYRYTGDWQLDAAQHEVKDHSLAALRRQLAESRAQLGPHLALYQIHSATAESGVLEDAAVLDELARARDGGGLRIGVTVSGPKQAATVRRALEIDRGGAPLFASVQATWNLLERSCEDALREAHDAGRTVIVKEALANGRLTPRGDAATGALSELAASLSAAPDAVALAYALRQPFADVVLLGSSTRGQLASNVRALAVELPADAGDRLAALREDAAGYWQRRAALPWS